MSLLEAAGVWVAEDHRTLLEPTTIAVESGEIVAAYGEPGQRHTLLALALGGRLAPSGGDLRIDQDYAAAVRREQVALIDVPGVNEPDDLSALTTIVAEELAMAAKPARRSHVDHWLTSNGLRPHRDDRIEDLPPGLRTVALARLASLRPGVQFLVLAMPERYGIDPGTWLEDAIALAGGGLGVLATVSPGIAQRIEQDHPEIRTAPFGNAEFHDPRLEAEPVTVPPVGPAVAPAAVLETTEDDR